MRSILASVLGGAAMAAAGVGAVAALAPRHGTATGKAIVLATGDTWGEVEPCG